MESMVKKSFLDFWKKKKVFVTGHTGFKGSWTVFFLQSLGAKVAGYSLYPRKKDIIFQNSNLNKTCKNYFGDIRNYKLIQKSISNFRPDILIHMAAQPLVLPSYKDPKETFEININGTLNILEVINKFKIKSSIIVTTDKVYKNENKIKYFKETDILEGSDPYSSSKVGAEKLVEIYNKNFFYNQKINVVTARAGNVIGGGDRSEFRIIPDFFRSLKSKETLHVRFPDAIRPWQHVLDPLYGYLLLAKKCYQEKNIKFKSWNFSHKSKKNLKVKELISRLNNFFNINIKFNNKLKNYKEKKYLNLSSNRSNEFLKWKAIYNTENSIKKIIEWEMYFKKNRKVNIISKKQISDYLAKLK